MKKIVFIITAIMLCGFVANTQTTQQYTIKFDTDGGTPVNAQIVKKGEKITGVSTSKSNYTLVEWQKDGQRFDFATAITENITLKAIWEKVDDAKGDSLQYYIEQYKSLNSKVAELNGRIIDLKKNQSPFPVYFTYIIAGLLIVLLVLMIVIIGKAKAKSRKRKSQFEHLNEKILSKEKRINELTNELTQRFQSAGNNIADKKEIDRLKLVVENLRKQLETGKEDGNVNGEYNELLAATPPKPKLFRYADSIHSEGYFNHVTEQPNEDTVFELELENFGTVAKFTVLESKHDKVIRRPEFLNGCEKQVIGNSRLEVTPGKAQLQDGKWFVTTKANVNIL